MRLMGLALLCRAFFATGVTIARRQSFGNLDNLKGKVKHPGKHSGNVGAKGYESLREPKSHQGQHPYED